jgi:hypothetical protein
VVGSGVNGSLWATSPLKNSADDLCPRSDTFVNARTALKDHAAGSVPEEHLRQTLAVLIEEGDKAAEEARHYHEEIGIAVQPNE